MWSKGWSMGYSRRGLSEVEFDWRAARAASLAVLVKFCLIKKKYLVDGSVSKREKYLIWIGL
jgi:hypothetical protein